MIRFFPCTYSVGLFSARSSPGSNPGLAQRQHFSWTLLRPQPSFIIYIVSTLWTSHVYSLTLCRWSTMDGTRPLVRCGWAGRCWPPPPRLLCGTYSRPPGGRVSNKISSQILICHRCRPASHSCGSGSGSCLWIRILPFMLRSLDSFWIVLRYEFFNHLHIRKFMLYLLIRNFFVSLFYVAKLNSFLTRIHWDTHFLLNYISVHNRINI